MSKVSAPRARSNARRPVPSALRAEFASILSRVETHARIYFRGVKCPHRKADCVAETVALAWKWLLRLAERGKDANQFPSALATLAARAVRSGRKACGQEKAKDVMNERTQCRCGFVVGKLPDHSTLEGNPLFEALQDNQQTPPDEQAAFRIDFPAWLGTRTDRDRRMVEKMGTGEGTGRVAALFALSPARVSQMRREFKADWDRFCADEPAPANTGDRYSERRKMDGKTSSSVAGIALAGGTAGV
jgi:hypothetical protein